MRLLPLAAAVLLCLAVTGARAGGDGRSPDSLKAEYLYIEANTRLMQNSYGPALYMLRRAHELAPNDVDIAGAYAEIRLYSGQLDLQDTLEFEQAYQAMKRRWLADETDVVAAARLDQVARVAHRDSDVRRIYRSLMQHYPSRQDFALEYASLRGADYTRGDTAALDEVMGVFDRLEADLGPDPMLVYSRARVYMMAGDTAAMTRQMARLAQSHASDPAIITVVGNAFESVAMTDSAMAYYDRACRVDSTCGDAQLARARLLLARGDSLAYDRRVNSLLREPTLEFGPKLEILTDYVRTLFEDTTRREQIQDLFAHMLAIHSGEAELHKLYGAFLSYQEKPLQAAEHFGYAMDLAPTDADAPRFCMQTALQGGDTIQAIASMRRAAARMHNPYYNISASALLELTGDTGGALAMLDSFIIEADDPPQALSALMQQRGDLLYRLERTDSALSAYRTSLAYDPDNAGSLNNLAYFMAVDSRDLPQAEVYARRAVRRDPENPTYIDTYAWVLFKQGDYEGARRQIDEALRLSLAVDTVAVDADTMMLAETIELVDLEAEGHADRAAAIDSDADSEAAGELLQEVVDSLDAVGISAEIYDHAGDIYYMCGQADAALQYWQKALRADPGNKAIKKKVKSKKLNVKNKK